MPDLSINQLPASSAMADDALLVVYQNGTTNSLQGSLMKSYVQNSVTPQVNAAQQSATAAAQSAQEAEQAATGVSESVTAAQTAAQAAQAAKQAVEDLGVAGETLQPGEQVQVTKTVDSSGAVTLTFSIPQGATGAQGPTGATGEQGVQGAQGETGPQGEQGPQGIQGPPGETGPQGISITAATVLSDGTLQLTLSSGSTLNAGNVVGPQGPQGSQGPTGPAGSSIQSIERTSGTGAAGTVDTYTITLTDGSTTTFQVYNGANGTGSGDFMANGSVAMTGALQMGGNAITGMSDGVNDTDGVTVQQLNAAIAQLKQEILDMNLFVVQAEGGST